MKQFVRKDLVYFNSWTHFDLYNDVIYTYNIKQAAKSLQNFALEMLSKEEDCNIQNDQIKEEFKDITIHQQFTKIRPPIHLETKFKEDKQKSKKLKVILKE